MNQLQSSAIAVAMLTIFILVGIVLFLMLGGCTAPAPGAGKHYARITFYNRHEDKYGSHIACSKYRRAIVGVTVAAEPCYPFGTRVCFPDLVGVVGNGVFTVEDRGSAVTNRKASYGTCPVFDIYAGTKRRMKLWDSEVPDYLPFYQL